MRIVVVHPYPVHSGAVGGVGRVFEFVKYMAGRHSVSVYGHATDRPESDRVAIAELKTLGVDQHLFSRPACGVLQKARWWGGSDPYYVSRNRNPAMEAALEALDRRETIDVVHLELGYLARLLDRVGRRPLRVLAEQEVMSLATERLRLVPRSERSWYERAAMTALKKAQRFESTTLRRFDRVYGITSREAAHLSETIGRDVPVLPHVVDISRFKSDAPEGSTPTVLFVGNFKHRPNLHALRWFISEIWAKTDALRMLASLEIVGPNLPEDARRLVVGVGGRALGYVADLPSRYAMATVVINPIQSGGGMRGKVLEAFAAARAVVSTPMGLEGVDAVGGRHCLVAAEPGEFAAHVEAYLRDPALRRAHTDEASKLVVQRYSAPSVFSRLERDLYAATDGRSGVRNRKAV